MHSCDTISKLQNKLGDLRAELEDEDSFKSFYGYCFDYAKEKDQKFLPPDIAIFLWELLLGNSGKYAHTTLWCRFLTVCPPIAWHVRCFC